MLGSKLILAWKNALGSDVNIDGQKYYSYLNNLNQTVSNPHGNSVSIKFIYFVDANKLSKKK